MSPNPQPHPTSTLKDKVLSLESSQAKIYKQEVTIMSSTRRGVTLTAKPGYDIAYEKAVILGSKGYWWFGKRVLAKHRLAFGGDDWHLLHPSIQVGIQTAYGGHMLADGSEPYLIVRNADAKLAHKDRICFVAKLPEGQTLPKAIQSNKGLGKFVVYKT